LKGAQLKMEKFPRYFIIAAICYLLAGVLVGIAIGAKEVDVVTGKFIHAHLNLAGFMAMFIYGVAYHILPRFNATPVKNPALVGVHFYAVNAGLVGMIGSAFHGGVYMDGPAHTAFITSGIIEGLGIMIFAFNILPILIQGGIQTVQPPPRPAYQPQPPVKPPSRPTITPDMRVAEVIEKWPSLLDVLIANGFKTLAIPSARASFAKTITIEQAGRVHRVDMDKLITTLNSALEGGSTVTVVPPVSLQKKAEETTSKGKKITRGEAPESDTLVGALLEAYPESKPVFEKHYGEGCFSCPGQAFETIAQTAGMHGIKAETILDEIRNSIKQYIPQNG
jgi:hypothetical protein